MTKFTNTLMFLSGLFAFICGVATIGSVILVIVALVLGDFSAAGIMALMGLAFFVLGRAGGWFRRVLASMEYV